MTAHHLDDQAETFMMRLARGAGVRGLAGMRRLVIGARGPTCRCFGPCWVGAGRNSSRSATISALTPAADPGNSDEQFERVRVRRALAAAGWLDSRGVATSARNLGEADRAPMGDDAGLGAVRDGRRRCAGLRPE